MISQRTWAEYDKYCALDIFEHYADSMEIVVSSITPHAFVYYVNSNGEEMVRVIKHDAEVDRYYYDLDFPDHPVSETNSLFYV